MSPRAVVSTLLLCFVIAAAPPSLATTFVVDTAGDGADLTAGDGACVAAGGGCTLRAAIEEANASVNVGGPDAVHFAIPGAGPHVIAPTSALPAIVDPAVLDGYTQPGSSVNTDPGATNAVLRVVLDGALAGPADGLDVLADDVTIRGLVVCNWARLGPGDLGRGIRLQGARGVVEGSFLGTDPTGLLPVPNGEAGVRVDGPDGRIGGTDPAARNLVSGNMVAGVDVTGAGAVILGNLIGLDAPAQAKLGNGRGVRVVGPDAVVGAVGGVPNVISGNGSFGVQILGGGDGAVVAANLIGTDPVGAVDRGNGSDGVLVQNAADVLVGGAGAGNLVSGNGRNGIALLEASAGRVIANVVGTDAGATEDLGNANEGILVDSIDVRVEDNLVAFNEGDGVALPPATATSVRITRNRIFSNVGLGIDLESNGVTANDATDADTGSNGRQNFPVLDSADSDGVTTDVTGTLTSKPGLTYRIEVFGNDECDTSDHGEAERFLGAFDVTTNGAGVATFDATVPGPMVGGTWMTATATDPAGSTSELSECVMASGPATTSTSSTTSSTIPGGSTTTTVSGGSTTTSTAPIPCLDSSECGDGNACTVDACTNGFCAWTELHLIPGVVCHVTNVRSMLEDMVCQCACPLERRLRKIEAKFARAERAAKAGRCKRSVGAGRRQARRLERKVNKLVRKGCLWAGAQEPVVAESSDLAGAAETLIPAAACQR
ncbi:MAG TPA: right-handed parallel beta-helix repeat-containing protein [Actinomycetota bacterium]